MKFNTNKEDRTNLKQTTKLLRLSVILLLLLSAFTQYSISMMVCEEDEMACCCMKSDEAMQSGQDHSCCCEIREVPRNDAFKSSTQSAGDNLSYLFTLPAQQSDNTFHSNHSASELINSPVRQSDICIVNSNLRI